MDNVQRDLSYLGGLARGYPPALSPNLDDFEIMRYIRQPLRPTTNEFSILINVALLQPDELDICVLNGSKIKICAKHERKQNLEGLWMTRDAVYTYELPSECCNKTLKAQWFADNYLLITASSLQVDEKEYVDRVGLVPERVETLFKPALDLRVLKEFVEDIRKVAQDALQCLRFAAYKAPSSVEKDIQDMVDKQSGVNSMTDSGITSQDDSPVVENVGAVLLQ